MLFKEAKNVIFWNNMKNDSKYQFLREQLFEMYEKYCTAPIENIKYSEFKIYGLNGSRKEYEASYFHRRGRLNTFAVLTRIYDTKEYLEGLEDTIWAICDEFTWALPAHLGNNLIEKKAISIDLFAAETGFALAEIMYLLDEKLSPFIKERIKYEINRRIIYSFENEKFHWEKINNNWSAVCAGSVGVTFMYIAPERFKNVKGRLEAAIHCFLSGYEEDGACKEGLSYWKYGFGFFVYYAQLLKEFTNGQINLFENEKIKSIAKFQQIAFLQEGVILSFADTNTDNNSYNKGLTFFLKKVYGDEITIPPKSCAEMLDSDNCNRWASFIRSFVWCDDFESEGDIEKETIYLKNAEIFIAKKEKFSFSAKCGVNSEPHNHNDVGSFIFAQDNKQIFCDMGMGEYTKEYFDAKRRYDLLVNSSRGHSVPIINGAYQKDGKMFTGKVISVTDNEFEIEISRAYDVDTLKRLVRKFIVNENGVEIIDHYEFCEKPESIIERFVTLIKPEFERGIIKIGNPSLKYSQNLFECECHIEEYQDHNAIKQNAYLINLKLIDPQAEVQAGFVISSI